jgi:lipid A ethanolaminephosphotransferase
MKLKLFRSTEFAESSLFAPFTQRMSAHPAWVSLLASLWLATACNAALWQELLRVSALSQTSPLWSAVRLAVIMAATFFAVFSILSSRRLLKPLITLLFTVAALCCHLMLNEHQVLDSGLITRALNKNPLSVASLMNWQLWATLFILALVPSVLLWRTPVRRLSPVHYLLQNGGLTAAAFVMILMMLVLSSPDLSELVRAQPQLQQMTNPFGPLQALAEVAKTRLTP